MSGRIEELERLTQTCNEKIEIVQTLKNKLYKLKPFLGHSLHFDVSDLIMIKEEKND